MTKILLVNPNFPIQEGEGVSIPLGILFIGTYLEYKGYEVKIVDCNVEKNYPESLKKEIQSALCVGLSVMTVQIPHTLQLCQIIKSVDPSIPIVLGGAHPTLFPFQTARHPSIYCVVIGEGEESMYGIARSLEGYENIESVEGIAFKKGERVSLNPRTKIMDLNELPRINYRLLSEKFLRNFKDVQMSTSRGCPHRCTFCINTVIKENKLWRAWSPERTVDEIENVLELGAKTVTFWDDNFFVNKKRVERITDEIISRNLDFEWNAGARADYFKQSFLNLGLLKKLKKSGLTKVGIGAESGSQRILDYLHKDITVEEIITSSRMCYKTNIEPTYSFMVGLPYERREDILRTLALIRELSKACPTSKFLGPQLFRPYPGGILYKECLASGWKEPKTLNHWANWVSTKLTYSDPFDMPWIDDVEFVNLAWFYSILLVLSYEELLSLYSRSDSSQKRSTFTFLIRAGGIGLISLLGKFRLRTGFFKYPIESKILRKYREILSS